MLSEQEVKRLQAIASASDGLVARYGSWFSSNECTSEENRDTAWLMELIRRETDWLTPVEQVRR